MAKTIGSLSVGMSLSITDFVKNLDKVKNDLETLDTVTKALSGTFENSVAGIMGDAVHKFAKSSKLGADQAVAFTKELKSAGLPAESIKTIFERTSGVLSRFADKAGEASGAMLEIFGKIGTSDKAVLKDFQALESMGFKAFKTLADELTKVEGKAVSVDEVMKRIASGSLSGKQAFSLLTTSATAKEPEKEIEATKSKAKLSLETFVKTAKDKIVGAAKSILSSVVNLITNPFTVISGALASYGVYKIYGRAVETFAKTEEIMVRLRGLAGEAGGAKIGSVLEDIAAKGRIASDVVGGLAGKFLAAGLNSQDTASMLASFSATASAAGSGAGEVFNKLGEIALALRNTGEVNAQSFAELAALGLPVYDALAKRLSEVTGEAISAERAMEMLTSGQVSGTNALNALLGLQGNDNVKAQAEAQANSLSGIYARLSGEIEGFFSTMGGAIAEALDLKGFNQGFIDFIESLKTNFETGLKPAIENIGIALAAVRDVLFAAFKGLVDFFTRFDETDASIGNKVNNVRSIVIQFAQSLMGVLQQIVDLSISAIEKLANAAGGVDLLTKYAQGIAGGAAVGAGVGFGFGGIGAGPGALLGALGGALGVSMGNERFGESADFSGFRTQMEKMFQGINETIGQVGNEAAISFMDNFIKNVQRSLKDDFSWTSNNSWDMGSSLADDMSVFFESLSNGLNDGSIGFKAFLNQVSGATTSAIAIFKREMELGTMSSEQFDQAVENLRQKSMDALINAFSEGKITGAEFDAEMKKLQATFDSLKPPADVFAPTVPTKLPDWIQQLVDGKSPLDTYREKLAELENALNTGQILPDQFAAGATMLADELERAVGSVEELKNPGALLAGSKEAYSQILKIQNQGQGESPQQRLERLAARANELAQQQARTQEQILAATLNNNPVVTATFGG